MKVPGEHAVANKINVMESKPARVSPGSAVRTLAGSTSGAGSESAASAPDVQLTGAARGLAAIEQSLRALPAVDELRVSAVKQRLQDGSYQIDPQRVADRLLRLESDLAPLGAGPLK
jgi:negative regulator of flagellin synthesis FlgM